MIRSVNHGGDNVDTEDESDINPFLVMVEVIQVKKQCILEE